MTEDNKKHKLENMLKKIPALEWPFLGVASGGIALALLSDTVKNYYNEKGVVHFNEILNTVTDYSLYIAMANLTLFSISFTGKRFYQIYKQEKERKDNKK